MSDLGTPFVLTLPEHMPLVGLYNKIAKEVADEVIGLAEVPPTTVTFEPSRNAVVIQRGDTEKVVDPYELRVKCLCAACISEVDGR